MAESFLQAIAIGFVIAAVVGPIGLLCIGRTIQYGFWGGFSSGLGAATADGIYGIAAVFGLVAIESFVGTVGPSGRFVAGVLLIYLGVSIYRMQNVDKAREIRMRDYFSGFLTILLLTLSNPATVFSFLAIFTGLGMRVAERVAQKIAIVAGIFLGSVVWWFLLALAVHMVRGRLDSKKISMMNKLSGLAIGALGLAIVLSIGNDRVGQFDPR